MEKLESIRAMGPDNLANMLSVSKKMKGESRFHIQLQYSSADATLYVH